MSKACAFGGTTTLVDFANWRPGTELIEAIEYTDAYLCLAQTITWGRHFFRVP